MPKIKVSTSPASRGRESQNKLLTPLKQLQNNKKHIINYNAKCTVEMTTQMSHRYLCTPGLTHPNLE